MLRTSAAGALLLGLVSAEDKNDLWLPDFSPNAQETSCGNCFKTVGVRAKTLCNTGMHWTGGADPYYYTDYQKLAGGDEHKMYQYNPASGQDEAVVDVRRFVNRSGGAPAKAAPARGLTVEKIREIVGETEWYHMNCKNYLSRYKTGYMNAPAGSGAACVRDMSKEAILQADRDVLQHYRDFATSTGNRWGYPSSYASPGKIPENVQQFGTGWGGDIPQNWCGSYMMDMLCHVAFPQVLGHVFNNETDGNQYFFGRIRAVDQDSCENVFSACFRRQPPDDETGDFTPYEMRVSTAGAFRKRLMAPDLYFHEDFPKNQTTYPVTYDMPPENMSMEVTKWCQLWKGGYGLARAGTGVASEFGFHPAGNPVVTYTPTQLQKDKINNEWDHATWEASSSTTASLLLVIATSILLVGSGI